MTQFLTVLVILAAVVVFIGLLRSRNVTIIYPPNVGLMYRDGRFQRELQPGRYAYFDPLRRVRIVKVSTAPLPVALGDVSVLSKDQFSFRIALSPIVEVTDARAFMESQPAVEPSAYGDYFPQSASHAALQPLLAGAALEVVGGLSLREIFADLTVVTEGLRSRLAGAIPGASVERVLLTSVTLPPETRRMFTDVERSKIEAEASLERARGEQAALRALANAARLLKDNPALANLRFLQTLEQAPGPKTIVLGNAAATLSGMGVSSPQE